MPSKPLLFPPSLNAAQRETIRIATRRLPPLTGAPVRVVFQPSLRAWRGRLLIESDRGHEVHAAAFVRERRVVLESALLADRRECSRILVHELFHFSWLRLGNPRRRSWEQLLRAEWKRHARGELGWSSEWRKAALTAGDLRERSRRWREYACESYCDTAAWLFSTINAHGEYTLAARHRELRRHWFRDNLPAAGIPI
ncbi:MAG TPA: hypothetical protein DEH78_29655 [Solibacterales bacterium]|nr:hypothetical protein [Bryobacterales bacterium]